MNSKAARGATVATQAPTAHGGDSYDQPPADEFLSDVLLGKRLNVSPAHVWHMAARGVIPQPYRLGRAARWRWSEILAALKLTQAGPDEHLVARLNESRAAARARKQGTGDAR